MAGNRAHPAKTEPFADDAPCAPVTFALAAGLMKGRGPAFSARRGGRRVAPGRDELALALELALAMVVAVVVAAVDPTGHCCVAGTPDKDART